MARTVGRILSLCRKNKKQAKDRNDKKDKTERLRQDFRKKHNKNQKINQWKVENMKGAMNEYLENKGALSVRQLARAWQVPRATLQSRIAEMPVPSESSNGTSMPSQDAGTTVEKSAEIPVSAENTDGTPPQDVDTTVEKSAGILGPSESSNGTNMPQQHASSSCLAPKSFYDFVTVPSRSNRRVTNRRK